MKLLTRQEFNEQVFARDNHKCVVCGEPAVDAHHLIERKLWDDGGYYLDNGASLCEEHHWEAEITNISPTQLRLAAGIENILLPPGFDESFDYDKWGNKHVGEGLMRKGPMFHEEQVQKALRSGGFHKLYAFIDLWDEIE